MHVRVTLIVFGSNLIAPTVNSVMRSRTEPQRVRRGGGEKRWRKTNRRAGNRWKSYISRRDRDEEHICGSRATRTSAIRRISLTLPAQEVERYRTKNSYYTWVNDTKRSGRQEQCTRSSERGPIKGGGPKERGMPLPTEH